MLFLLFYFIYLYAISIVTGWSVSRCIYKERPAILHIILTGIAANVFVFSLLPFWTPLNQTSANYYHIIMIGLLFWFIKPLYVLHKEMLMSFLRSSIQMKIGLFLWTAMVLLVSAMPPFLIDNETYYIQSIR